MKKLPQRPRSHVLEDESEDFVKRVLPKEWLVNTGKKDYGIDFLVEIVEGTNVTGAHFLMQLKSTDKLIVNKKGLISHACKTSTLQYFLERPELVIYLVYDSENNIGYWIWIQDFLRNLPSLDWKKQNKFSIKIPQTNIFDKEAVEKIKKRVLHFHKKERLLNTIGTLNHPAIDYGLELKGNIATVSASYKYPNAVKDYPLNFEFALNFDDSEEGKKAQESWGDVFKKGIGTTIKARFIEKIKTDFLRPEVLLGEDFALTDIEIEPLKRGIKFPAKIEVLDKNDSIITKWNYIEFEEVRHGTDETEFSNEAQNTALVFSIIFNFLEKKSKLTCKPRLKRHKVAEVREALFFQKNFSRGNSLRMLSLRTDSVLITFPILQEKSFIPSEEIISLAEKLIILQEKFHVKFEWPEKIREQDILVIEDLINIINTGQSFEGDSFEFPLDKIKAMDLADKLVSGNLSQLMLVGHTDRILTLFGREINLGRVRVLLPQVKSTHETAKRFEALDTWPDDQLVKIEFEVSNPGVIIQYINWMPTTQGESNA